jgi:site-specific DNA-cytosine methylase
MDRGPVTPLTHASFFSGIGGFDVGLERAGFRTVSHSEVKPYSCAVLETHWPDVPNLGDLNALCPDGEGVHDCVIPFATVWTGGFPCSDFSIMGRRKGLLGGNRSSLGLVFLDLVRRHRPPFVVLENVPGLLTAAAGRDLGVLLGLLGDIGYGWSFRLLDARNFGLPQARRRLFIVATADPRDAGAVLDDSTRRRVDAPSIGRQERAVVARGGGGPAGDDSFVLGPTYSPSASPDAIQRRGASYPITPNNFQYVRDDLVVQLATRRGPILARDDGSTYTVIPSERQWVKDSDGAAIAFHVGERGDGGRLDESPPIRPPAGGAQRLWVREPLVVERHGHFEPQVKRDGTAYTLLPVGAGGNIGQQYVTDALVGRDGGGDGGDAGAGGADGRPAGASPAALGPADDWVIPTGPAPEDHADGVRAAAGPAGRLDDSVGVGDGEVGPKHLDVPRWHVLGRTVPVPIVEWIGLGIRAVIDQQNGETSDDYGYAG